MKLSHIGWSLAASGILLLGQAAAQQSHTQTQGQSGQTMQSQGNLSMADQHFLTQAAEDNQAEIQIAQLAQQRGSSDAVKQFAQTLVTDHTQAQNQLQQLAQNYGMTMPTTVNSKDQKEYNRLSSLSGEEFDKAFLKQQVRDHQKDISKFNAEAQRSQDSGIKSFASSMVPALQKHLQMAQDIEAGRPASGSNMQH